MSAEVPGLMTVRCVISWLFRFSPSFTPPTPHSNKHNHLLFPELRTLDSTGHLHTSHRKGLLFPIKTAVLFFASRHHGGTELGGKRYLFEITRLKDILRPSAAKTLK
jgi:hypothetical protein